MKRLKHHGNFPQTVGDPIVTFIAENALRGRWGARDQCHRIKRAGSKNGRGRSLCRGDPPT
eukprot:3895341-Lingulodinium_polyedra.AAC.1